MIDITRDDITAARARIAGDVRHTPLMRIAGKQLGIDCAELWLKLEHLQVGGSFKARGMFNRMRANPVPETASQAKRDKLAALGAVLTVRGASYADALAASLERQARR